MHANLNSGGGNGMSAFPTGVHFDVPVIDGDAMGRAYPTMYHGKTARLFVRVMLTSQQRLVYTATRWRRACSLMLGETRPWS